MASRWQSEKKAVLETALKLLDLGLVTELSGNVSVRLGVDGGRDLLAVTPTSRRYSELSADDVAVVDFELEPVEGDLIPSSESLLHVGIYSARPNVGAIIHTHSVFASVVAVSDINEVPPMIDEAVVAIGGPIRVSEYAFPGSQELANNVCVALGPRNAAIIKSHGAVGLGRDLGEALDVCTLTERIAQVFYFASKLGDVQTLPEEVVEAETAIYRMRQES